jgi:hypothetical protein
VFPLGVWFHALCEGWACAHNTFVNRKRCGRLTSPCFTVVVVVGALHLFLLVKVPAKTFLQQYSGEGTAIAMLEEKRCAILVAAKPIVKSRNQSCPPAAVAMLDVLSPQINPEFKQQHLVPW